MPDAEDSTGDGGHREGGEVKGGQTGGQAGVLHTHLDGDGDTLGIMQTEQPTDAKAYSQTADIVEHHHKDDEQASSEQTRG